MNGRTGGPRHAILAVILIAVALPPPVTPAPRPVVVEQPVNYCWALSVIVAMILAYLAYRKWSSGKKKKK